MKKASDYKQYVPFVSSALVMYTDTWRSDPARVLKVYTDSQLTN